MIFSKIYVVSITLRHNSNRSLNPHCQPLTPPPQKKNENYSRCNRALVHRISHAAVGPPRLRPLGPVPLLYHRVRRFRGGRERCSIHRRQVHRPRVLLTFDGAAPHIIIIAIVIVQKAGGLCAVPPAVKQASEKPADSRYDHRGEEPVSKPPVAFLDEKKKEMRRVS